MCLKLQIVLLRLTSDWKNKSTILLNTMFFYIELKVLIDEGHFFNIIFNNFWYWNFKNIQFVDHVKLWKEIFFGFAFDMKKTGMDFLMA